MIHKQEVFNYNLSVLKKFVFFLSVLGMITAYLFGQPNQQSILLVNHTGYSVSGEKKAVFQTHSSTIPHLFQVIDTLGNVVFENTFSKGGLVNHWHTGNAYAGFFTKLKRPGIYQIKTVFEGNTITSFFFVIKKNDQFKKIYLY